MKTYKLKSVASDSTKKPLIVIGVCFAALSLAVLHFPARFPVILTVAVIVAAIFAFHSRRQKAVAIIMFISIVSGAVIPYMSYKANETPANQLLQQHISDSTFTGKVTYFNSSGSYSGFDVKVSSINGKALKKPINIHTYCFSSDYADVGDTLTFKGTPQSVYDTKTKEFDTVSYLRSKKIFITVPNAIITSSTPASKKSIISSIKQHISSTYVKYLPRNFDYTTYNVSMALVLGDKAYLNNALELPFQRSGTLHLLCVSGMHLTVILGFAYYFLQKLNVHKKSSAVIIIALCIFYVLLTGAQVSILRAGIMSCVTYIAMILGRKSDGAVSLFLSAAIMCAFDPYLVLGIGGQLSFLATLGIIIGMYVKELFFKSSSGFTTLFMSVCSICFTLPLSAYSFGGIAVFSVFGTFIASPFCDFALVLLLLLALISPLSAFLPVHIICTIISVICNFLLVAFIRIAEFISSFKFAYIPFPESFNKIILILCTALIVISVLMYTGNKKGVKTVCVSVITLSTLSIIASFAICVFEDSKCHVYYYRKNQNDIQINIKLGSKGTLILNDDNVICTDTDKIYFDEYTNSNYLVVIPNEKINPQILSNSVKAFDQRFGIKEVHIANFHGAKALCSKLQNFDINAKVLDSSIISGSICVDISQTHDGLGCKIQVFDGTQEVCAVISDKYNVKDFSTPNAINAFFTSASKNQFDIQTDIPPNGKIFYARLKKDQTLDGVQNIFKQNSICIY